MRSMTVVEAKNNFEQLLNDTTPLQEPIQIVGSQTNAVLISEEEWQSIQKTLYSLSNAAVFDGQGAGEGVMNGV